MTRVHPATVNAEMKTPIVDFINQYIKSDTSRFHMPGHKGRAYLGFEPFDITEIEGAGNLYSSEGIIAESEANASSLFGFGGTFYSTEGSSQCIKAMLYLARLEAFRQGKASKTVLAGRNAHKAFVQACALNDLEVMWLYPESPDFSSVCRCVITPEGVAAAIDGVSAREEKPFAVYLTSPDYTGYSPDIAAISEICRERDVLLLVDNAHGAYLRFLNPSKHPVDSGAFMSSDSAHKTLPVLTGGAYLHLSKDAMATLSPQVKSTLALFGSSSPSYLILQSLDLCNKYLSEGYTEKLAAFIEKLNVLKNELKTYGWEAEPSDPLKLVFDTASGGYAGSEAAEILRRNGVECEFADCRTLVLMATPENTDGDLKRLAEAFKTLPAINKIIPPFTKALHPLKKRMSIREAIMSPHETIPAEKSEGRICASPAVSCPPEIPIAVSGEKIDNDTIELFAAYGIKQIEVVK